MTAPAEDPDLAPPEPDDDDGEGHPLRAQDVPALIPKIIG